MIFNYISKLFVFLLCFLTFSCKDVLKLSNINNEDITYNNNLNLENNDIVDKNYYEFYNEEFIDYYTAQYVDINFLNKDLVKIKINNNESKKNNNTSNEVIIYENSFYSINFKGQILRFNLDNGDLIERIDIKKTSLKDKTPISFSLFEQDFIVGFKTGEIIRVNTKGEIQWIFKKEEILNTPIKISQNFLFVLYPEELIILSSKNGDLILAACYDWSQKGKFKRYKDDFRVTISNKEFDKFLSNNPY